MVNIRDADRFVSLNPLHITQGIHTFIHTTTTVQDVTIVVGLMETFFHAKPAISASAVPSFATPSHAATDALDFTVDAYNASLHVKLYNAFNKTTANAVNFFHAALAANSAPKHVTELASALYPVVMDVNVCNYAKLYPAVMAVNVNICLVAFPVVMMPSVTFVAAFRDANFAIVLMPVEIAFNVWEIVSVEIVIVETVIATDVTVMVAILEDAIWVTVIADVIF